MALAAILLPVMAHGTDYWSVENAKAREKLPLFNYLEMPET